MLGRLGRIAFQRFGYSILVAVLVVQAQAAQKSPRAPVKPPEPLLTLSHEAGVYAVAFSPDGKRLLTGSGDLTVRLWDLPSGKEKQKTVGSRASDMTFAVTWSPDGKSALIGGGQYAGAERLVLWDVENWREIRKFEKVEGPPRSVSFSEDGRRAVSGSLQGVVNVFDVDTGKLVSRYAPKVGPANAIVNGTRLPDSATNCVDVSANGQHVLWTGGYSNFQIQVFETETGKQVAGYGGNKTRPSDREPAIVDARFSRDGKRTFIGDSEGSLRIWGGGNQLSPPVTVAARPVRSVAFSKNEQLALVGVSDGELTLWQVDGFLKQSRAPSNALQLQAARPPGQLGIGGKTIGGITRVALSDDNHFAAAADIDGTVRVWDLQQFDFKESR